MQRTLVRAGLSRVPCDRLVSKPRTGSMHAGTEVQDRPDPGGAPAGGHERGSLQLLTRLA
jgi:hypothetical protein